MNPIQGGPSPVERQRSRVFTGRWMRSDNCFVFKMPAGAADEMSVMLSREAARYRAENISRAITLCLFRKGALQMGR